MIFFYSGTPGSGKSLHAAQLICNWARSGSPVIGNFPVNLERYKKANFHYVVEKDLTPAFLIDFATAYFADKPLKEDSILLIIDEAQRMFNPRSWQDKDRAKWLEFFSLHRHYGYKIVMIAQNDRMIDRQIRVLFEYEYTHRKISNYGWKGGLMSLLMGGETIMIVKRWYPVKEKIESEIMHGRKRLYSVYDTFGRFGDAAERAGTQGPCAKAAPPESSGEIPGKEPALALDTTTDEEVKLNYTKYLIESEDGR